MTLRFLQAMLAAFALPFHAPAWGHRAYPTQDSLIAGTTVMGETLRYPISGPARVTVSIVSIATVAKAAEMALSLHRLTGAAVSRRGTYAKASADCVNEFLGSRW